MFSNCRCSTQQRVPSGGICATQRRVRATWARNARKSPQEPAHRRVDPTSSSEGPQGSVRLDFRGLVGTRSARSHTSPFSPGHASMNASDRPGWRNRPGESTTFSQWSHFQGRHRVGRPPAVENSTSLMHHTSVTRRRFPAFRPPVGRWTFSDQLRTSRGPVRKPLVRDPHALEVLSSIDRQAACTFPGPRGALGRVPLRTVRRRAGWKVTSLLDHAFAGP